jgi:hypothetical protein
VWNSFLVDKLTSIGFTTLLIDDCVFVHGDIIFMVYMDNGIFLGSEDLQLQEVVKEIQNLVLNSLSAKSVLAGEKLVATYSIST